MKFKANIIMAAVIASMGMSGYAEGSTNTLSGFVQAQLGMENSVMQGAVLDSACKFTSALFEQIETKFNESGGNKSQFEFSRMVASNIQYMGSTDLSKLLTEFIDQEPSGSLTSVCPYPLILTTLVPVNEDGEMAAVKYCMGAAENKFVINQRQAANTEYTRIVGGATEDLSPHYTTLNDDNNHVNMSSAGVSHAYSGIRFFSYNDSGETKSFLPCGIGNCSGQELHVQLGTGATSTDAVPTQGFLKDDANDGLHAICPSGETAELSNDECLIIDSFADNYNTNVAQYEIGQVRAVNQQTTGVDGTFWSIEWHYQPLFANDDGGLNTEQSAFVSGTLDVFSIINQTDLKSFDSKVLAFAPECKQANFIK